MRVGSLAGCWGEGSGFGKFLNFRFSWCGWENKAVDFTGVEGLHGRPPVGELILCLKLPPPTLFLELHLRILKKRSQQLSNLLISIR